MLFSAVHEAHGIVGAFKIWQFSNVQYNFQYSLAHCIIEINSFEQFSVGLFSSFQRNT